MDEYYTKPEIAKKCLAVLGSLKEYDLVLEPSAGNGSFLLNLKHDCKIGLDINPTHPDILKYDFLKFKMDDKYKSVLIVGNPPFGTNNELSKKFLEHSLSFPQVKTIAFILPNVYNKYTKQKFLPKQWRIKSILELPKYAFEHKGIDFGIECSFFVFSRSNGRDLRTTPKVPIVKDFSFGNKDNFDLFIFGAAPKRVISDPMKNNRGYYLKSNIKVSTLKEKLSKIKWKGNSSASGGVFWLTKKEIAEQYRQVYEQNNKKS